MAAGSNCFDALAGVTVAAVRRGLQAFHVGLRYNGRAIAPGAQTYRLGDAWPARRACKLVLAGRF